MSLHESPALTYQAHNLLVLNLLVLVHALPRKGRVLLRVTCAQRVDCGQDGALHFPSRPAQPPCAVTSASGS